MEDKFGKILNILLYVLIGISVVLGAYFVFIKEMPSEPEAAVDITMYHMFWAYVLIIIATVIAIAAPVIQIIMNPGKAKSVLIGIAGFVVLGVVAYLIASGSTDAPVYEKFDVSATASKRIGASLYATYILGGLAIAATIFSGISKVFK
ncbi:MAG: hypothetical protein R6T91_02460 [Bacteroidales bacterium]